MYSVDITKQKYQVAEKVGGVSRFMSIDKNDRYLLLVLRYYTSRVASFEALLKSYNKDTKNQENSNEISVAMLYDKRRIYYGKGDCVQAVSQRVGPTSEMDNEVPFHLVSKTLLCFILVEGARNDVPLQFFKDREILSRNNDRKFDIEKLWVAISSIFCEDKSSQKWL